MTKPVDNLMSSCPLKHEIRANFWMPFVQKLKRKPISYLTLYSPPLMDVKYLQNAGLIALDENVYKGVVGVTIDNKAYADSTSMLDNRLDLLLYGNINDLLKADAKSTNAKMLAKKFPFDVINLDYTDSLFNYKLNADISPHFEAIDTVLSKQKAKDRFTLLVTTKVDVDNYNEEFVQELKNRIDENIADTPNFADKLLKVCNCRSAEEFINSNSNNFFALSLLKYILGNLKDHSYTIKDAGIKWLIRDNDNTVPDRYMLHLAFDITRFTPPKAKSKSEIGKRSVNNVEHKCVTYIRNQYGTLRESTDFSRLEKKHSVQITAFNNRTFELKVPDPK